MTSFFTRFAKDETGAITVDWVVLTAAILTLGAVVVFSVRSGAQEMADNTGQVLADAEPPAVQF